ncbi:hypothetical protein DINM_004216 [Dirofilaria immitis]|nr:hypothetical protein [Dirofilaria immitis]
MRVLAPPIIATNYTDEAGRKDTKLNHDIVSGKNCNPTLPKALFKSQMISNNEATHFLKHQRTHFDHHLKRKSRRCEMRLKLKATAAAINAKALTQWEDNRDIFWLRYFGDESFLFDTLKWTTLLPLNCNLMSSRIRGDDSTY